MDLAQQLNGDGKLLGDFEQLVLAHGQNVTNLLLNLAHVPYGLHNVAGARLALGTDHRGALGYTAQRFSQVAGAAHKGHVELGFIDVVHVVGGGEDLGLVDVIDVDGLQYLGLHNVADTALCHHGDGHCLLDAANHGGVAHAAHAAGGADVCRDALEGHDGTGARFLGDMCLLGRGDVHDDAAFEHLGELTVELDALGRGLCLKHCSSFL